MYFMRLNIYVKNVEMYFMYKHIICFIYLPFVTNI